MSNKTPLVSIITITYNHEDFIADCINSVLMQTYQQWELLIIDDGSTDNTEEVIKRYNDLRIKYIRQDHKGISNLDSSYNKALSESKGELIAILEGDDCWPPDKLEKQVPAFSNPEVILTWGIGIVVDEKCKFVRKVKLFSNTNFSQKRFFKSLLMRNFIIPASSVMIRKSALLPDGFYQPMNVPFVDYPTWLLLVEKGRFEFISEVLGYWRLHSEQMSQKLWKMRLGELNTYKDLWHRKKITFTMFLGLVLFSLSKHVWRLLRGYGN